MKKTDIWMPLYIGDYLADTARLTTEQHGAYLLMLMDHWRNGPLPDDDDALAAVTKLPMPAWLRHKATLAGFFTVLDEKWFQKRLAEEKKRARAITAKRSVAGKAGAGKRWGRGAANE